MKIYKILILTILLTCKSGIAFCQKTAGNFFDEGIAKYDAKDYQGALTAFNKCAELEPNSELVFYNRAHVKEELKDLEGAYQDYSKAIELKKDYGDAYFNRGLLSVKMEQRVRAMADFRKSKELGVDGATNAMLIYAPDAFYYYKQGEIKFDKNDYIGALKDLEISTTLKQDYAEAYFAKGVCKVALKRNQEGCLDFRTAIQLGMIDSFTYYSAERYCIEPAYNALNRGIAMSDSMMYQSSIDEFSLAIKLKPNLLEAYYNRGIIKDKIKDWEGSIHDYSNVIRLDSNNIEAYYNRGIAKGKIKDYNGEIKDLTKVIDLKPDLVEAYTSRGLTKKMIKDYEGALVDYSKIIVLQPNNPEAYFERGQLISLNLHRYDEAIPDYNMAINLNPKYIDAYKARGFIYEMGKDYSKAMEDYSKWAEFDPRNGEAFGWLGGAKIKLGITSEGCKDLKRAEELGHYVQSWLKKDCD